MEALKRQTLLGSLTLIMTAAVLAMLVLIFVSLPDSPDEDIAANARKMAGELADNNLPEAAISEYQCILDKSNLTDGERGAIHYLIAKLYFEDIGGYEQAAANYIRARALDTGASYYTEAGKNLIASLEKMGRRLDARRELDRQAGAEPNGATGKLVAIVGSERMTLSDFNNAFELLSQETQQQFSTPEKKKEFLDHLIGRELIYHAALREGLDRQADAMKELKALEKDYLVSYYTQKKIAPTVRPDTADLAVYYQVYKDNYGDKAFEEVRQQVTRDYLNSISEQAVREYIGSLLQAEPVQTFEENLK